MPKKKKEPEMEQVHGRIDLSRAKTLDERMGLTPAKRYKQGDEEEYRGYLKTLNLTDMQVEAQKHGLIPISDRGTLESRLIREFKKTSAAFYDSSVPADPMPKVSAEAERILALGR